MAEKFSRKRLLQRGAALLGLSATVLTSDAGITAIGSSLNNPRRPDQQITQPTNETLVSQFPFLRMEWDPANPDNVLMQEVRTTQEASVLPVKEFYGLHDRLIHPDGGGDNINRSHPFGMPEMKSPDAANIVYVYPQPERDIQRENISGDVVEIPIRELKNNVRYVVPVHGRPFAKDAITYEQSSQGIWYVLTDANRQPINHLGDRIGPGTDKPDVQPEYLPASAVVPLLNGKPVVFDRS